MKHAPSDLIGFCVPYLILSLACVGVYAAGCGAVQHPTVEQAELGLSLACDALARAMALGTKIPAGELARQACDTERTTAIMAELLARAARNDLVAEPPDWAATSATPAPDAGAP